MSVTDTSSWGDGAGDLFVSFGEKCVFVEIKSGPKKKFTKAQIDFQRRHPDAVVRVETVDEAFAVCKELRRP